VYKEFCDYLEKAGEDDGSDKKKKKKDSDKKKKDSDKKNRWASEVQTAVVGETKVINMKKKSHKLELCDSNAVMGILFSDKEMTIEFPFEVPATDSDSAVIPSEKEIA